MQDWIELSVGVPRDNELVIFYLPEGRYVWARGKDVDQVKREYPEVTHWKVISREPNAKD